MKLLKTLVIVVITLSIGISGEETTREGKCNGGKSGRGHAQKHKFRKPYPLVHHAAGNKFNGKSTFMLKENDISHVNANAEAENGAAHNMAQQQPFQEKEPEPFSFDMQASDALVADPYEIPSSFGISPRLNIAPNGEILTSRSINFDKQRNFDDSNLESVPAHEHMDEDHDHFHKIRTARSAPSKTSSGPEQLSESLGNLSDTNTLQAIDVHNGAQSGDYFQLNASGNNISANNQGSSSATGSGTISSSGSTTVTTSGSSPGWKK